MRRYHRPLRKSMRTRAPLWAKVINIIVAVVAVIFIIAFKTQMGDRFSSCFVNMTGTSREMLPAPPATSAPPPAVIIIRTHPDAGADSSTAPISSDPEERMRHDPAPSIDSEP